MSCQKCTVEINNSSLRLALAVWKALFWSALFDSYGHDLKMYFLFIRGFLLAVRCALFEFVQMEVFLRLFDISSLFRILWTLWTTVSPRDLAPWASPRATASSNESKSGSVPMRSTAATSKTEASSGLSSAHHVPLTSCKACSGTAGKLSESNHPGQSSILTT